MLDPKSFALGVIIAAIYILVVVGCLALVSKSRKRPPAQPEALDALAEIAERLQAHIDLSGLGQDIYRIALRGLGRKK